MRRYIFSFILITYIVFPAFSQNGTASDSDTLAPSVSDVFIFKPVIGIGTGMFSFYGDLYTKHFQEPVVSRIGFELHVAQKLSSFLLLDFNVLFGKLGANERQTQRNLNFQSEIRSGSVNLIYNFGNFLPARRYISPYISVGFESLEFLSKTDLLDQLGNKYYYWTSGAIKNLDEKDPLASDAYKLVRDYTYESDIREMNLDGFGKYQERSFAVPFGAGVLLHMHDRVYLRIGSILHYTFTDYIDGVTDKSVGSRKGNSRNDMFLMNSFSLHYDLFGKEEERKKKNDEVYDQVDFLALPKEDTDGDGVTDFNDSCHGTPVGAKVNAKGCPLDDDGDAIATYRDKEENTTAGAITNADGVALTDEMILRQYQEYMDSTGQFAKFDIVMAETFNPLELDQRKVYMVQLGIYKEGLPPDMVSAFLSISDIESSLTSDSSSVYTAGAYSGYAEAEKRKNQLVQMGVPDAKVICKKKGKYYEITESDRIGKEQGKVSNKKAIHENEEEVNRITIDKYPVHKVNDKDWKFPDGADEFSTRNVVFRVQLGAYSKPMSNNFFEGIEDVFIIKTEDALYRYATGSFSNMDAADKHRILMKSKGYIGSFVTAYKNGKRIPLEEAGAFPQRVKENIVEEKGKRVNTVDQSLVEFKVQLGVFRFDPVTDFKNKTKKIKGLKIETTKEGLIRYVAGSFPDYASAKNLRDEIAKNHNLPDAVVAAYFNNQFITVAEALELLK